MGNNNFYWQGFTYNNQYICYFNTTFENMKKASRFIFLMLMVFSTVFIFSFRHSANNDQKSNKAKEKYISFCAGCHGNNLEAFINRKWDHGNTSQDIFKAIKEGYKDEGMPSFKKAFSDKEINELVAFIQQGIKSANK